MTAYLLAHSLTAAKAAEYLASYFAVVAASRLLFWIFLTEKWERSAMNVIVFTATLLLFVGHYWPLALIAVGIQAPFYPVYLGRMSHRFSANAQRMTLLLLLSAQVGLFFSQALFGGIADRIGIANAYWFPACLMLLAGVGFNIFERTWPSSSEATAVKAN